MRRKTERDIECVCIVCGKHFMAMSKTAKICSRECRRVRERYYDSKQYKTEKYKKALEENKSLPLIEHEQIYSTKEVVDLNREAAEHGMSYGQYVALHHIS